MPTLVVELGRVFHVEAMGMAGNGLEQGRDTTIQG